eukprot:TRINITY_DN1031_c0_g1_i5.p1 TRINITY_DN1031_c0_g1~~TRINITY_DN1031_c0_g1_i5.p1  ORF type:complete len:167 (-),score=17.01 TRINITY_DN1031_c0_g1_i5:685-1185(-)
MSTARRAPYATTDNIPQGKNSASAKQKPAAMAPWEKEQSGVKFQSKGGDMRKQSLSKDPSERPRTSNTAPFGTADNLPASRSASSASKISQTAPFGTADNLPSPRVSPPMKSAPPFGTSADMMKPAKNLNAKPSAPWERDESRYTHRGKGAQTFNLAAPYATEPSA